MRDDVRTLPIIWSAIKERTAKYVSGIDFFKQAGCKYIISSAVNSMLVVPLCIGSVVFGYICSTEFKDSATINNQMLSSITLFGRLIGKIIESSTSITDSTILSNRELEVLKRISWGESTKEMADIMDISELTVKQYVKTGIKKLGAQNRAHGVSELFRKGILS
jgi:DNA-binding CsgD family transcriptional regulator